MSSAPSFRFPDGKRSALKNRTNGLVYNNIRPTIYVSKTGQVGSYTCWNKNYNNMQELKGQLDISKQTEVIIFDIEKCISTYENSFVGIAGYDQYDNLDTFYLVHKPEMKCDLP